MQPARHHTRQHRALAAALEAARLALITACAGTWTYILGTMLWQR